MHSHSFSTDKKDGQIGSCCVNRAARLCIYFNLKSNTILKLHRRLFLEHRNSFTQFSHQLCYVLENRSAFLLQKSPHFFSPLPSVLPSLIVCQGILLQFSYPAIQALLNHAIEFCAVFCAGSADAIIGNYSCQLPFGINTKAFK